MPCRFSTHSTAESMRSACSCWRRQARGQVRSGFVSRNNPDETAKNWYELNEAAGIDRARTLLWNSRKTDSVAVSVGREFVNGWGPRPAFALLWNVVPWYIGKESRIRAANSGDIVKGLPYLRRLLELLPKLRVMVLVGRKAGRARVSIQEWAPQIEIFEIPHPSPSFVNRGKHHRQLVLQGLIEVKKRLDELADVGNGPG